MFTTLPCFNMPRFRAVAARLEKGFHPDSISPNTELMGGEGVSSSKSSYAASVPATFDALVNCLERSERFVSKVVIAT